MWNLTRRPIPADSKPEGFEATGWMTERVWARAEGERLVWSRSAGLG